jgi:hypothetical protein
MNPVFPPVYGYPGCCCWPYLFPFCAAPVAPPHPAPAPEPRKESKWVNVNVIVSAFPIPVDARGKSRFRLEQDHFVISPCNVDINNMTGNDLISALGGGVGSSIQEVYEHGAGEWTLGFSEIKFDGGAAKRKCKEYGWNRAKDGDKRHNVIWVVFKRA